MKRKILVLLKDKNFGNDLIHEITGVSRSHINRMYKTWKNTPSLLDAGRTGRPPKLDKEQREELNKLIEENKDASGTTLKKLWENTCRLSITIRSIENFRKKLGYELKNARQKPILREENKRKRFSYARQHLNERWDKYISIDESDFQLYPNKKRVWIRPRERFF